MPVIGATQLEPVNILGAYMQGREIARANQLAQQQAVAAQRQQELMQRQEARAEEQFFMQMEDRESQRARQVLEDKRKGYEFMSQLAGSAVDQASYDQALRTLQDLGVDTSKVPTVFDPKVVKGFRDSTLTEAQRLDAELRRGTLDVQRRQAAVAEREVGVKESEAKRKAATPAEGELDPKIKRKREELYPKAVRSTNQAVRDIDNQIALAKRLRDHEGLAAITGGIEGRLPSVREKATAAQSDLDTLLARGTLRSLTELRAASETGGALGNVSNQDTTLLRDSVAALNQSQGKETFRDRLDDYIRDLEFAKDNVQSAFNETYSYRGVTADETPKSQRRGDPSLRKGSEVMAEADRILGL